MNPTWQSGDVQLYLGDCLEVLPTLGNIDAVVTDPPYPNNSGLMSDMLDVVTDAFSHSRRICIGPMLWFWNSQAEPLNSSFVTSRHVWHKTNGWQAGSWEAVNEYNGQTRCGKVYSFPNVNVGWSAPKRADTGNHPTPKPVKLLIQLLKDKSSINHTILDPFMGSGTTGVACVKMRRKFIGIEIKEAYFEIAKKRIMEAQMQPRLEGV